VVVVVVVVAVAAAAVAVAAAATQAVFQRRCQFLTICSASVYESVCNIGGVLVTGENGSIPRKSLPVLLFLSKIPHVVAWN
jgi:hypothetical protein